MTNKAQSNAQRLLKILSEDILKKKKAPIFIAAIILILTVVIVSVYKNKTLSQANYLISREDKLSYADIDTALRKGINLESLGEENKHILYYLAKAPYSLEIISYLKKSGVKLNSLNSKDKNPLEDILLNLNPSHKNLEKYFYNNISSLIGLELKVSDETIREASQKCEKDSLMTCIKIAFYFKVLNKEEQAKSYAQRSCYTGNDHSICDIAKNHILKD